MKIVIVINKDGSSEVFDNKRKMTKTAVLSMVKEALEIEDTKQIIIK